MEEVKKEAKLGDLFAYHQFNLKPIRQQLIDEAFEQINLSRQGTKWKPLTKRSIALRVNMSCKSDTDCHYLLNACRKGIFSKVFFGATRTK